MSFHETRNKDIERHPLIQPNPVSSESEDDSSEMQVDKKSPMKLPEGHEAYEGQTIEDCPYMKIQKKKDARSKENKP